MMAGLAKVTTQVVENIYVGGRVIQIAINLGLRNRVAHLEPFCGYNLINIEHGINKGLVRQEGPDTYNILVLRDPVHQFTIQTQKGLTYIIVKTGDTFWDIKKSTIHLLLKTPPHYLWLNPLILTHLPLN